METKHKEYVYDVLSILMIIAASWISWMCLWRVVSLDGDAGAGHYALWAACAKIWHSGEVPLWNPFQWGGFSTVGSIQEVFYPVLIALEFIFWDSTTQMLSFSIFPAYIAIHMIIAGCGLYVLGRSRNRTPQTACTVSLLTIASGCFVFPYSWAYVFGSYCWMPWVIWALYRMVETKRAKWIAVSGFILTMLVLASTAQGALFAVLVYALLYAAAIWENRSDWRECCRLTLWFLISGFIGMGTAAIQLFPFIETNMNAFRFIPGLTMVESQGKIPLSLFKEEVVDVVSLGTSFGGYFGKLAISTPALALIIIGYFFKRKKHDWLRNFSVILMFGALLYTIGFNIVDVFWYIPGFNAIREPLLYAPLIILAGSILMLEGIGAVEEVLCSGRKTTWGEALQNTPVCNGILVVLMLITMMPHMLFNSADVVIKIVIILVGLAVVFKIRIKKALFYAILSVIVVLNMFNWSQANLVLRGNMDLGSANERVQKVSLRTKELIDELDEAAQDGGNPTARFLCWYPGGLLPSNVASVIGERDCFAYLNPIYKKTYFAYQFLGLRQKCQLQNVKYVLLGNENEEFRIWLETVIGEKSEIAQTKAFAQFGSTEEETIRYIDTTDISLGPAWVVNQVSVYQESPDAGDVENAEAVFRMMNDDSVDFSKTAFVEQKTADRLDFGQADDVHASVVCTDSSANKNVYQVQTDADGILVTSDFCYPGWQVRVDGRVEDVVEVNYCFQGVVIEQGEHTIEFIYKPTSLLLGICMGVVAILVSVACICIDNLSRGELRMKRKRAS